MNSLNVSTLPLALTKRASVLDGLVLLEVMPINRIKALLKSNLLFLSWSDEHNFDSKDRLIAQLFANEKKMISDYLNLYNRQIGAVPVKYKKPKHQWGRVYPSKSLGLTTIRKVIRNTLIDGLFYDLDISNAHPNIIKNLCDSNNIPCPIITRYCNERATIKKMVAEHYSVSEDVAKELFISLCFFGKFSGWAIRNKLQGRAPLEFITLFERELNDIAELVKRVNPSLYETARKKKEEKGETNFIGSFFALYIQEHETRIVESILCYLINNTDLMKIESSSNSVGTYEYDGIKLFKKNVDAYDGGLNAVIDLLNEKTIELTGFNLKWSFKPFENVYDLTEWIDESDKDDLPLPELASDMKKIMDTINNADAGVCEILMEILPNNFIFSVSKDDGSKGDWYGWNKVRWEKSDAPLRKAIIYDVSKYWLSIMEKWDKMYLNKVFEIGEQEDVNYILWRKTRKEMSNRLFALKTASGIASVVAVAKTLMANYILEFDAKEDLFGCENGVIDIGEECFRPYRFDDYITWSCGYDFTPNLITGFKVYGTEEILVEDKKVLKPTCRQVKAEDITSNDADAYKTLADIYKNIFPDRELRDYFFKVISTGMSGRAIEKFFIFNGAGRNGKGFTNEFLQVVFGNYYESISPTIFSEDQKRKTSSGANPEIAKIDKKRYVVAKEPQRDQPLHNSVIKDLTGGGFTSGRMLYSSKTNVKLCMTCVMECNEKPPFSEAPKDADILRINDVEFVSKFTDNKSEWDSETGLNNFVYPLNPTFKDMTWKKAHANCMLNLLLQNLLLVKAENYIVDKFKPESVRLRSLAYLQNSYDIHNMFISLFEKRIEAKKDIYKNYKDVLEDEDWTILKIATTIRKSSDFYELPKKKQKEYDANYITDFLQKNSFYKPYIYTDGRNECRRLRGWRLKPVVDEDSDSGD